jgi:hypothetical protein
MDAVASGTRCKNFFYHANINPRYGETLTPEQWEQAINLLEHNLGLDGHARFVVEHDKDGRVHQHIVWCRIDPDTMTAVSDSFTARDHERTSRELEQAFGLEPVDSVLIRDRENERPGRRAKNWETFRGNGSGIDPQAIKEEVTALWSAADSGSAFAAALAEHGYILCKGDRRDFCIIDAAGNEHSLARRIDGARAAAIRERMEDIDRDELPTVAQGRELAHDRAKREEESNILPPLAADVQEGRSPASPANEAGEDKPGKAVWDLMAEYAEEALRLMRDEQSSPLWPVEERRDQMFSRRAAEPQEGIGRVSFDGYAAPMEEAIREHGAIPTQDGLNWWQRAGIFMSEVLDNTVTWAKDRWNNFVEMIGRDRDSDPEGPDMEK